MDFPTVQSFNAIIQSVLPEPHAGLLSGISFGTKATISPELMQKLITTGTLHIVALSGMNISIVIKIVTDSLLWVLSKRIVSVLAVFIIIGFIGFVGISPSAIRAAIMGSLTLFSVIMGRSNWPILTWCIAIAAMLTYNVSWLFDLSFQLSALATLGIILFGGSKGTRSTLRQSSGQATGSRGLKETNNDAGSQQNFVWLHFASAKNTFSQLQLAQTGKFVYSFIADDLRVTLAAQVFTIPIILFNFHRVSIISPLPNILIGPIIGPVTILGWVTAIAGTIWYPLGLFFGWTSWVLLQYLLFVVSVTSQLPLASVSF